MDCTAHDTALGVLGWRLVVSIREGMVGAMPELVAEGEGCRDDDVQM